jgi:hypothetical protein
MSKSKKAIPPERLDLYDKLIASHPEIEPNGKTMPYTSINGHMFSFLDPQGHMGLMLSTEDREEFMKKFDTRLMEQYGRVMKEYVAVPDELLEDTGRLAEYLRKSYDYVSTLKPKPTKK